MSDEVQAGRSLPPVVLIEGSEAPNALSVARCLGRRGIRVYALCPAHSPLCYSRYSRWIPEGSAGPSPQDWTRYLLGRRSDHLRGAVLLACADVGLEMLINHRHELEAKYRLDISHVPAQRCMLDKLCTYQAARAAGVATPRFWVIHERAEILKLQDELGYPLLVKPLLSHVYRNRFGRKFTTAYQFSQVLEAFEEANRAGIPVMLVEKIPGPDDRLCSYFTYLDETGTALFHFTKRVIRRFPVNIGPACYHITDWIPELCEPALKLFRHVGLRGLANVEFKRDERDGQLKLIECNARITGSNSLVADAGFDLGSFVYNRLVGLPPPRMGPLQSGMRLWFPVEDFHAFRQLRRAEQLTLFGWLRSVAHPTTFPYFRWSDPWPSLVHETLRLGDGLKRRLAALLARHRK
jgi:predicted ATP-grasp superfamily ATP-dependent carboligase